VDVWEHPCNKRIRIKDAESFIRSGIGFPSVKNLYNRIVKSDGGNQVRYFWEIGKDRCSLISFRQNVNPILIWGAEEKLPDAGILIVDYRLVEMLSILKTSYSLTDP